MRIKLTAACLALALAGASDPTHAAGPATARAAADAEVTALVVQLDADDWAARDAAAAKLVAKGDAVRPAVADAAVHAASPEVRCRAAGVIAKLDQVAADRPTPITLHVTDADPRAVFAEIAKQAAVPIHVQPQRPMARATARPPKVTVNADRQPFWVVVAEVCKQTRSHPAPAEADFGLTIVPGRAASALGGNWSGTGRFTFVAEAYSHGRKRARPDGLTDGDAALTVTVLVDPKVRLAGDGTLLTLARAVDDRGRSVLCDGTDDQGSGDLGPAEAVQDVQLNLRPPSMGATRLAAVEGEFRARVVSESHRVAFDDLAHIGPSTRPAGPYVVTLAKASVRRRVVSATLKVAASAPDTPPLPSPGSGDLWLEDAAGNTIAVDASPPDAPPADGVPTLECSGRAEKPIRGPVRLVWQMTTADTLLTVPVRFHDLHLPRR